MDARLAIPREVMGDAKDLVVRRLQRGRRGLGTRLYAASRNVVLQDDWALPNLRYQEFADSAGLLI